MCSREAIIRLHNMPTQESSSSAASVVETLVLTLAVAYSNLAAALQHISVSADCAALAALAKRAVLTSELLDGPRGSGGLAAAVLNGTIFVFGGEWFSSTGGGVYSQVWAYEAASDSWRRRPGPAPGRRT